MAEPRARTRTTGQTFQANDLQDLLWAYGDNIRTVTTPEAPAKTITTLDEIITDFIIETCHYAALSASYSRRQKIKVEDFKFVLRRDERLLGRVLEQLWRENRLKKERQVGDFNQMGDVAALGQLEGIAVAGGVNEKEMRERKKGRGKGKRKRDKEEVDGRSAKRIAS